MNIDIKRLIFRIVKHEQHRRINVSYREIFEWVSFFLLTTSSNVLQCKVSKQKINYREMLNMQSYDGTITTKWTSPKIYNFITCKKIGFLSKIY